MLFEPTRVRQSLATRRESGDAMTVLMKSTELCYHHCLRKLVVLSQRASRGSAESCCVCGFPSRVHLAAQKFIYMTPDTLLSSEFQPTRQTLSVRGFACTHFLENVNVVLLTFYGFDLIVDLSSCLERCSIK